MGSTKETAADYQHAEYSSASIRSKMSVDKGPVVDEVSFSAEEQLAANWVNDTPEERALKRKLDWRILPCTWVLYLLGYLDRANIG